MTVYVLFLIVGLGLGSVYAALALGLVVTYKGTGVINFAQGAMAMWGAFVYDELRKSGDLVFVVGRVHVSDSVPVAVALGIASSAAIGGLAHLLVFRPLRRAPALAKIVASLGLLATLQALVTIRFGSTPRAVKPVLPTDNVELGSLVFSVDRIYLSGLVIALALGAVGGVAVHPSRHRDPGGRRGRTVGGGARLRAAAAGGGELDRRGGDRRSGGDLRRAVHDARRRRATRSTSFPRWRRRCSASCRRSASRSGPGSRSVPFSPS